MPVGSVISEHRFEVETFKPDVALMLGHRVVHVIDEDDIRLAGRQPRLDELGEQPARVDGGAALAGLGADEVPFVARAHGFHELVGDKDAMVEVQCLPVEVARRLSNL